jgi:hypothetical protein
VASNLAPSSQITWVSFFPENVDETGDWPGEDRREGVERGSTEVAAQRVNPVSESHTPSTNARSAVKPCRRGDLNLRHMPQWSEENESSQLERLK